MNLRQIKRIAPKILYDSLFNEDNGSLGGNISLDQERIETKGDLLDLAQLIEDHSNFILQDKVNSINGNSPIQDFIHISRYLNICYGLFTPKEAREHLKEYPFLNLYPNLYRTMEVWAWG